jgi:NTE family protein
MSAFHRRRSAFAAAAAFAAMAVSAPAQPDMSSDGLLRDHLWSQLTALPKGRRPVVGLALSGGAARAAAHTGVLTVLTRARFPIDVVAGTSMGAIIGALYAAGDPPRRLRKIMRSITPEIGTNWGAMSLLRLVLGQKPLTNRKTEEALIREFGPRRFEELAKPFACVAMDLDSGEKIVFRDGPVSRAVRASSSLPGIIEPVEYRQRFLVDGGVIDDVPVDAAKLLGAQWVLASVTLSDFTRSRPRTALQGLQQVLDIRGSILAREQSREANFVIEPAVGAIPFYDTSKIPEAIDAGIVAAQQRLPAAEERLILSSLPWLLKTPGPSTAAAEIVRK